ncbi:bifunctional phosphoribosylaminoimidazolecarboxamide formyltransferase/IMP cyclohydrolase [Coxiella burnetii]|uniref:bifunctional phosphoribosylaminoimidazolecarboxamide formyltransferase/IMP cyclohydrolase n=1 Tax=Coxiella burnetii TaxID=777 RepID=UPI0021ADD10C|nr:bifunctional phosphoribosylaminoimidazolecarboxamide formyltransferase/IMP cyclohydrolase [Coxiella burnetii]
MMSRVGDTERPIKRALISTADKIGLIEFISQLVTCGVEIIATGGTAELLKQHQLPVIDVFTYTGFPEIMDGRVKTLHPKIHAGLLARRGIDEKTLDQHAIKPIDLLVVNLYPFVPTVSASNCSLEKAVEQIDIGGPSMLRAAAKNFAAVTVVVDPEDYSRILEEIKTHHGSTTLSTRKRLAQKTFEHLSYYDAHIATYLAEKEGATTLPARLPSIFKKKIDLRYGENPHQTAALYSIDPPLSHSLAEAQLLQGKPLSFNNLLDSDCAYRCVYEGSLSEPACVIVKHATPAGAARAQTQLAAYEKAYATDPLSAFGGIVAFNAPLEAVTAEKILSQQFVEVIIAPDFPAETLRLLQTKPNLRVLRGQPLDSSQITYSFHSITGGVLCQEADATKFSDETFTVVTRRQPTAKEQQDLYFAWQIVKYVKSNAIVYAKDHATLGIGSGQTSRVFAAKIAILKAEEAGLWLTDAVMASDAFFPFSDSIEIAAKAGITAVIQPGGSKRDEEVIKAANEAGMAMLFTHQRHFRH